MALMAVPPQCPCSLHVPSACVTPGTMPLWYLCGHGACATLELVWPWSLCVPGAHMALVPMSPWYIAPVLACSYATLVMPTSPQYVVLVPIYDASATLVPVWSWCLCHLAALMALVSMSPWCTAPVTHLALRAHPTPVPVPLVPAQPSPAGQPIGKVRRPSRQCAPTAAPETCTRCGAPPGASPRPPSACSLPSWCWCWVSGLPR